MLSIDGMSLRQIAVELKIDKDTANRYVNAEAERRAEELGERRETEKARAVSFYTGVIVRALKKSDLNDQITEKILNGEDMKVTDRSLDAALKARERIDKILGVDAATKIDTGLQALIEALG